MKKMKQNIKTHATSNKRYHPTDSNQTIFCSLIVGIYDLSELAILKSEPSHPGVSAKSHRVLKACKI